MYPHDAVPFSNQGEGPAELRGGLDECQELSEELRDKGQISLFFLEMEREKILSHLHEYSQTRARSPDPEIMT